MREKLEQVRAKIAAAARSAGRDPSEVRIIAVTKTVPVERIREVMACGLRELGENRVQEAIEKQGLLQGDPPLCWHLVGHLQRNKAKLAAERFDWIHSLDSLELMATLDQRAAERRPGRGPLEVLLQVNVSGEESKHGCRPDQTDAWVDALLKAKHLHFSGLMTLAPFSSNPEEARPFFEQLRRIREQLCQRLGSPSLQLSMGMSQDFEVAVQEGASMVRLGTALFGDEVR